MKGSLNRKYNFSIIVTTEDIKSLSDMITKDFEDVRYDIETSDGAKYKIQDINTILEYPNIDSRKIIFMSIRGNKEKGESFYLPNICISLFDTSTYDKSIILDLNEMDEKEITHYTSRVDEFANRIKAPYWWIYNDNFYWIIGYLFYFVFSIFFFANTDISTTANKVASLIVLSAASAVCIAFSIFIFHKIALFFYPEICFAIGEQERHKTKKEKIRNLVFGTIVGMLIFGVATNIIAYYIIRHFEHQ